MVRMVIVGGYSHWQNRDTPYRGYNTCDYRKWTCWFILYINLAVMFLFEKGMTNRQRREWRKERFFKRRTMRYIRTTIKSFPEQDFSPNIEKYHLLDVIFLAISIIGFSGCKYNLLFYQRNQLGYCSDISNLWSTYGGNGQFFIVHIEQRAIKKDDLLVFFAANVP